MNISSVNGYSNYYNTVNFGSKTKAVQKILPELPNFMQEAKTGTEGFGLWLRDRKETVKALDESINRYRELIAVPQYDSIALDNNTRKLGSFRIQNGTWYDVCDVPKDVKVIVNYIGDQPYYRTDKVNLDGVLKRSEVEKLYGLN